MFRFHTALAEYPKKFPAANKFITHQGSAGFHYVIKYFIISKRIFTFSVTDVLETRLCSQILLLNSFHYTVLSQVYFHQLRRYFVAGTKHFLNRVIVTNLSFQYYIILMLLVYKLLLLIFQILI
jgi:hypothetical protein